MKPEGREVEAQSSCREFRHGLWSLEEEPSVCENCEFYEDGRCFREAESEAE